MMKKVLYGVALALFASVSVGSLQSCKDDLNDFQTSTSYDLSKLHSQLDDEAARLKGLIDENAGNIAEIKADYAKLSYVNEKLEELSNLKGDMGDLKIDLENQINGAVSTLNGRIDQIETEQTRIKSELEGKIGANAAAIEELEKYVKETLKAELDGEFEQVYMQLEEAREMISQVLNVLQEQIDEINGQVEVINEQISKIDTILQAIVNQIDKQVTGLLIQGVQSPVFGDFRLPIGIKSNILFNWYGYNDSGMVIEFPSAQIANSATGEPGLSNLAALKPEGALTIAEGNYFEDVNLGRVYVTVNPVGATFDNLELSIEPSAGDPLPLKVVLTPSDEVLYHGYSRSADNGFYQGDVVMEANDENIKSIRVNIDSELKSAMKDALKDRSKRSAVALVKAVYDQMSGLLPAYALRYDWITGSVPSLNEEDMDPGFSQKANAVLSQYDLAVATARPLSFKFLKGQGISKKLPILSPMENLILKLKEDGDLSLNLKPIKIDKVTIEFGSINISTDVTIDGKDIVITLPDITVKDPAGNKMDVEYKKTITLSAAEGGELSGVYDAIKEGIEGALGNVKDEIDKWTGTTADKINEQLNSVLSDVEGQVNSMINSINGQIEDMIENIGNKFNGVFDKINKAFDIYNKVANKVNNVLEDPNAYLQATALYSMSGSYGFASGDVKNPTIFNKAGGNAFSLYLTSYTGELIVPAFKKYVAITGVYKNGVRDNNADLAALNASEDLNKVLDGSRIRVVVPAAGLDKDNVYEFTYQALDYQGCTSTRKFYIQVN